MSNQTQNQGSSSNGNPNTEGNKKNNTNWQTNMLRALGLVISAINALPGVDYETRTTTYQATAAGPGYSIGDIIIRYDIIDVATGTIYSTLWFNQTTQATIAAPAPANITPVAGTASVNVINGPGGAAVNIQDGGNSITVDNVNLDTPLSTINANLTGAVRTYNTVVSSGVGTVPAGARVGSMLNSGSAAGLWNGVSIPAGVGIPFDAGGRLDTLPAIAFDATGTTFIIEYTS